MSKITFTLFFIFITFYNYSQESIEVCDKTFKVSALSEEIFYYGLAEGDKIIFSLEEINGKENNLGAELIVLKNNIKK